MKKSQYWFRKRRGLVWPDLGWGWFPISWEGWLLVVLNVVSILFIAFALRLDENSPNSDVYKLLTGISVITGISVLISIKKCRPND